MLTGIETLVNRTLCSPCENLKLIGQNSNFLLLVIKLVESKFIVLCT
jgi:hypothetical protein